MFMYMYAFFRVQNSTQMNSRPDFKQSGSKSKIALQSHSI